MDSPSISPHELGSFPEETQREGDNLAPKPGCDQFQFAWDALHFFVSPDTGSEKQFLNVTAHDLHLSCLLSGFIPAQAGE